MTEWTAERVEDLKTLWADGLSCSQIANALGGITRNAVIGKATRLKLTPRTKRATEISTWERQPAPRRKGKRGHDGGLAYRLIKSERPQPNETPVALMLEDTSIPLDQRKTLMELQSDSCRWPVGDPGTPDLFFCGGTAIPGMPYCGAHCGRAFGGIPTRLRAPYIPPRYAA